MKWLFAGGLLLVAACSGAPKDGTGDFSVTYGAPKADVPVEKEPEPDSEPSKEESPSNPAPSTEEAGPSEPKPVTLTGGLQRTSKASFGTSSDCTYEMVLEDVGIEVTVLDTRVVKAAVVTNRTHESIVECHHGPMPQTIQRFVLKEVGKDTNGTIPLTFEGDSGNMPKTTLTAKLVPSGDGFEATLGWHRVDLGAPYDWTVVAKVPLTPK